MDAIYDLKKAAQAYRVSNGKFPAAIGVPKKFAFLYPQSIEVAGTHIPVRKFESSYPHKQNAFFMLRG